MVFINSFSPGYIVYLVLVQDTALIIIEVVTGWVQVGRINYSGFDLGLPGTIQKQAPVLVLL